MPGTRLSAKTKSTDSASSNLLRVLVIFLFHRWRTILLPKDTTTFSPKWSNNNYLWKKRRRLSIHLLSSQESLPRPWLRTPIFQPLHVCQSNVQEAASMTLDSEPLLMVLWFITCKGFRSCICLVSSVTYKDYMSAVWKKTLMNKWTKCLYLPMKVFSKRWPSNIRRRWSRVRAPNEPPNKWKNPF